MTPMSMAWNILKDISSEPSFNFLGYSASQEPFGIVTYNNHKGNEMNIPYYQRSGGGSRYNWETGQPEYEEGEPKAGQWVPFFGYDTEGHYADSAQPYLIKPNHVAKPEEGIHKRYSISPFKKYGEWLDENAKVDSFDPNKHEEIDWDDANSILLNNNAHLAKKYREGGI